MDKELKTVISVSLVAFALLLVLIAASVWPSHAPEDKHGKTTDLSTVSAQDHRAFLDSVPIQGVWFLQFPDEGGGFYVS